MKKLAYVLTLALFLAASTKAQQQGASGSISTGILFQNFQLNMSGTQCLQAVNGFLVGTGAPCPNFVPSTVNAVGLTATPTATSNPANLTMEITGANYTGNAASSTLAASATQLAVPGTQCATGNYATGVDQKGNAICVAFPAPAATYPLTVAHKAFLAQTAAISTTQVAAPTVAADYLITLVVDCTGSGTVSAHVMFGSNNAVNVAPTCPNNAGNFNEFAIPAQNTTAPINLQVTITGTPTYDARVSVVQLGAN